MLIKCAAALVGGVLGMLVGKADGLLFALLIFVFLEYLSGVIVAIVQHKLSSQIGWKISRKNTRPVTLLHLHRKTATRPLFSHVEQAEVTKHRHPVRHSG